MDDSTTYKLIYFPVKAIGEPIRFLLSYGNIKFEDVRLDPEKWKSMKESTPFGQVPVLEINNSKAHQSTAICRYLGNIVRLAGKDEVENLEIDSIVDTIAEFRARVSVYNKEADDGPNKQILKEKLLNVDLPFYLERFDAIAVSGHMALGRLSWADLYFVSILDYCNGVMLTDLISGYSNLVEVQRKVLDIPSIKNWVERRPPSAY